MSEDTTRYREVYSDGALWKKLRRFGRSAGREVVEKAVLLYLVLRDPSTPGWAKTTVIGALGYLIAPIDAIPDLLPGVGFTDDLGVLLVAAAAVASAITPTMRARARRFAARLFGGAAPEGAAELDETMLESTATLVHREPS